MEAEAVDGPLMHAVVLFIAAGLAASETIQGTLGEARERSFVLELRAGDYIECTAQQKRVDLALRLYLPDGSLALEVDSPNGFLGPEPLGWIATVSGPHRLDVVALQRQDRAAPFALRIGRPRLPSAADRERAGGHVELWAGKQARTSRKLEDLARSVEAYTRAAERFHAAKWPFGEAAAWQGLAAAEGLRGRRREAIRWATQSAELFRAIQQSSGEARVWADAGAQHAALGEHAKAIEIYGRSAALLRKLKDKGQGGAIANRMAVSLLATNRYAEARQGFERAVAAYREMGDRLNEARNWISLGVVSREEGKYAEALTAYERALGYLRESGVQTELPGLYNNLGLVERLAGDFEQAVRYFEAALPLAVQQRDRPREVLALTNLGACYAQLNQRDKAEALLRRALAGAREINQRELERTALLTLARTLQTGRPDEARRLLRDAIELSVSTQNRATEGIARDRLGWLLAEQGDLPGARLEMERALQLRLATGDRRGEYLSHCSLAHLLLRSGNARAAVPRAGTCLAGSISLRDPASEAVALTLLMQSWRQLDRPGAAIFFGKEAINRYQELRGNIRQLGEDVQRSYTEGNAATYRELAGLLIAEGRLLEARHVLSLLKEEEYFELLRRDPRAASGAAGRMPLTDDERKAGERLTALGPRRDSLLAKGSRTREEDNELQALDKQLETGQREFVLALDQLADSFVAKPQAVRVQQLREAQGMMDDLRDLPAGAAALYTLVAPHRLHLILVTPSVQRAYEQPVEAAELAKRILDFRVELENPQGDPKASAQRLCETLIPPALKADLEASGAQTLMWSLDGPLRYLPLGALYDGERYLVERYRLAVFTPASQGRLKDPPKKAWRVAGLGVSSAWAGLPALPQVPFELRGIVREEGRGTGVMPGVLLLDQAFTRDALLGTRLRYPVLHIASHFHFQPGSGAESYLLLGDGSKFSLQDLRAQTSLFSQVDLLTLSACNTGIGDGRGDGREVESFAVLAQRQGAKAVVASLWAVADGSTAELMKRFYTLRQADGLTKAEAMQRAQVSLLRGENIQWRHPYFWAPFFVVGNWQ